MRRGVVTLFISLLFVALFGYAAVIKLTDYTNFRFGLSESPFISPFAGMLAWGVPAIELAIVVLLLWPAGRLAGLYASFVLMVLFTIYIAAMLAFGSDIPCSCGGVLENMSWPMHMVFNSIFVLLATVAILLIRKERKLVYNGVKNLTYAKGYSSKISAH